MRRSLLFLLALLGLPLFGLFLSSNASEAQGSHRQYFPIVNVSRPPVTPASGPMYGVNFISAAEQPADARQYQNGLSTGADWNRWPVYWFNIELSPGGYDWSSQDRVVLADIAHGLRTDAILLGTPGFYQTEPALFFAPAPEQPAGNLSLSAPQAATPQGLYEPIFTDGTDVPGPGKQINGNNRWARFVFLAVNRYKPGGVLAQTHNWPAGVGITHWEMWNEPDLDIFWNGSLPDFARLQKVGFLAAKQADGAAEIIFGALANNFEKLTYYNDVMALYDADPLAGTFGYFHDILATHSYFYAWQSWYHVFRAGNTLRSRGLDKPIWLNETGVAAWNDYPGPVWDSDSGLRATTQEQAHYTIQTAFYALYAGADAIFHFQLYDGCGNQPQGTNFPPHNGELCDANGNLVNNPGFPCAGDANGLFTNPTDAACFTQHPHPESPRPNLAAFQVLTHHVRDVVPYWRSRPGSSDPTNGPQEWIALYQPATGTRIIGLWARFGASQTAVLPATAGSATLVYPDGVTQTILPVNGVYTLQLPGASNQNAPWDPGLYPIGGRPLIIIEADPNAVGAP